MHCGAAVSPPGGMEAVARLAAIDFSAEIEGLTRSFTGRQALFEEIEAWLERGNERFFLLTALPGLGKSAIAARLTQRLPGRILAHHFCIAGRNHTVVPGAVLRSLAAQLAESLPGYGLALANTIKPAQLKINVNINVGTLNGGQATGVVIHNLKPTDPETELDILLRAPLAALNPPDETAFLLIDSLDEALTHRGQVNLVSLLSEVDDFPAWVRFLCTSRPERSVLRYFEGCTRHELEARSDENRKDLHAFLVSRFAGRRLRARCKAERVEPAELIQQVAQLAGGNFLYTRVLLDNIAAGRQPLDDLSSLPADLDGIYHGFLKRFSPAAWEQRYQPVLAVLAVAFQALNLDQLANFTAMPRTQLRQTLGVLAQFLTNTRPEEGPAAGSDCFYLFHQSFRDYLLSEERNRDFWCAPEDGHAAVTGFYLSRWKGRWADAPDDGYLFDNLATHLDAQADRMPQAGRELHALFENPQWRHARVSHDGNLHQGYVADLDLAWTRAEAAARKQIAQGRTVTALAACVHCALLRTEVNSLASGYVPALVRRALEFQLDSWTPQRALGAAARIPDVDARLEMLAAVLAGGRLSAEQTQQAYALWIETIRQIEDRKEAAARLAEIAPQVPAELLETVLQAALDFKHRMDRKTVLIKLLDRLPPRLYDRAVDEICSQPDDLERASLLIRRSRLAEGETRVQIQRQALELIFRAGKATLDHGLREFEILAGELDPGTLTVALQAAIARRTAGRSRWILALIPHIADEALEPAAAECVKTAGRREHIELFLKLFQRGAVSHERFEQIIEWIEDLGSDDERKNELSRLWWVLPAEYHARLFNAVQRLLEHPKSHIEALLGLVRAHGDAADPALVHAILQSVGRLEPEGYRAKAVADLAPALTGADLDAALELALQLESVSDRTTALTALAARLAGPQVTRVLESIGRIDYPGNQATILAALAPRCDPAQFEAAMKIALAMNHAVARGHALAGILPWAGEEHLERAVELAFSPLHGRTGPQTLVTLAPRCAGDVLRRLLEKVVDEWPAGFSKPEVGEALRRLDRADAAEILNRGLERARASEPNPQVHSIMDAFGRWITADQLDAVFGLARSLPDEHQRALAVRSLLPHFDNARLADAFEIVRSMSSPDARTAALAHWPLQAPPEMRERVAVERLRAARQTDGWRAADVLNVVDILRGAPADRVLEAVRGFADKDRSEVLRAWAPVIEERLLPAAMEIARRIEEGWPRIHALQALSARLEAPSLQQELELTPRQSDRCAMLVAAAQASDRISPGLALRTALAFENELTRAEALAAVAPKLSPPQAERAFQAVQAMEPRNQAKVLPALVPKLGAESIEAALGLGLNTFSDRPLLQSLLPRLSGKAREEAARTLWYEAVQRRDAETVIQANPLLAKAFRDELRDVTLDDKRDSAFEHAAFATLMPAGKRSAKFTHAIETAAGDENDPVRRLVELMPLLDEDLIDTALERIAAIAEPADAIGALVHLSRSLPPAGRKTALRLATETFVGLKKESDLRSALHEIAAEAEGGRLAAVLQRTLAVKWKIHELNGSLEPLVQRMRAQLSPVPEVGRVLVEALRRLQRNSRQRVTAVLLSGLYAPGILDIDAPTVSRMVDHLLNLYAEA